MTTLTGLPAHTLQGLAPPLLHIPPAHRREVAVPWASLLRNKAHEFSTKLRGRRIKGQGMIGAAPSTVREGFAALAHDGFDEYNLPQAWVESRQIPRVLHGRVPQKHATILDLGCGPGTSTRLLAHFADPTWSITGFDLTPALIDHARALADEGFFTNRLAQPIEPSFECQDLADPLLIRGLPIPPNSVDLAIACGVVGLYMHEDGATNLLDELTRVTRPGGYIALDAGPSIPPAKLCQLCTSAGFVLEAKARSFPIEPRPKLVFRKP